MNDNGPVRNDETLYRAVRVNVKSGECIYKGGRYTVRSKAFLTTNQRPSVDRAELSENDPALFLSRSGLDRKSGVVSFVASSIRGIQLDDHTVDVKPAPCPHNPAHAQIVMEPDRCVSESKRARVFRSLRKALAKLATKIIAENDWTLEPQK